MGHLSPLYIVFPATRPPHAPLHTYRTHDPPHVSPSCFLSRFLFGCCGTVCCRLHSECAMSVDSCCRRRTTSHISACANCIILHHCPHRRVRGPGTHETPPFPRDVVLFVSRTSRAKKGSGTIYRRYQGSNLGFGKTIIRIPSDNHYTIAPQIHLTCRHHKRVQGNVPIQLRTGVPPQRKTRLLSRCKLSVTL